MASIPEEEVIYQTVERGKLVRVTQDPRTKEYKRNEVDLGFNMSPQETIGDLNKDTGQVVVYEWEGEPQKSRLKNVRVETAPGFKQDSSKALEDEYKRAQTQNIRTTQVIDGFTKLSNLTLSERQKVQDDLFSMGFNSDTSPAWFKDYLEQERQQTLLPNVLQEEWIKYRDGILAGQTSNSGGNLGGINFDDL